ncbi:MAG: alpha/beta hydrolase [Erythrobacter sp.]|nr:alpha/beta hydrolase [Erythrobacter sp.]NCQ62530.1 alpha/beta hydrolase [Alphaproteobacteria bacterium]
MTKLLATAVAFAALTVPLYAPAQAQPQTSAAEAEAPARFSVEVVGEGARDAILIPGLLSPRSVWDGQIETLTGAGYRVHLVQVNGFGGTDAGANAQGPVLPLLVDGLASYIEDNGLTDVHVVGHSMGGFTALNLALDHPEIVDEIMIVDSLPFFSVLMGMDSADAAEPQANQMRSMMVAQAGMDMPAPDCEHPSMQAQGMAKTPAAQCKVDQYSAQADLKVGAQLMYEIMTTDLRPRLSTLKVPVTMLYPVDPPMVSAEMAQGIYPVQYAAAPDVTFVPVEGSRHFIMLDQPDAMNAALAAFAAE